MGNEKTMRMLKHGAQRYTDRADKNNRGGGIIFGSYQFLWMDRWQTQRAYIQCFIHLFITNIQRVTYRQIIYTQNSPKWKEYRIPLTNQPNLSSQEPTTKKIREEITQNKFTKKRRITQYNIQSLDDLVYIFWKFVLVLHSNHINTIFYIKINILSQFSLQLCRFISIQPTPSSISLTFFHFIFQSSLSTCNVLNRKWVSHTVRYTDTHIHTDNKKKENTMFSCRDDTTID